MTLRVAALAALVLVLAACGGGGGDTSATTAAGPPTTAGPPAATLPAYDADLTCPPPDQFVGSDAFTTTLTSGPLVAGHGTTWTITVTNVSTADLVLAYAGGQKADVTLAAGGAPVYRWSDGRTFSQAFVCDTVKAGASYVLELTEEGPLPAAGTYELTASLRSAPLPPDVHQTVTITP